MVWLTRRSSAGTLIRIPAFYQPDFHTTPHGTCVLAQRGEGREVFPRARLKPGNGRLSGSDATGDVGLGQACGLSRRQDLVKECKFGFEPIKFRFDVRPGKCPRPESLVTKHFSICPQFNYSIAAIDGKTPRDCRTSLGLTFRQDPDASAERRWFSARWRGWILRNAVEICVFDQLPIDHVFTETDAGNS